MSEQEKIYIEKINEAYHQILLSESKLVTKETLQGYANQYKTLAAKYKKSKDPNVKKSALAIKAKYDSAKKKFGEQKKGNMDKETSKEYIKKHKDDLKKKQEKQIAAQREKEQNAMLGKK